MDLQDYRDSDLGFYYGKHILFPPQIDNGFMMLHWQRVGPFKDFLYIDGIFFLKSITCPCTVYHLQDWSDTDTLPTLAA